MSKYTSKDIKLLKDLEPIQVRPGMFIGSTEDATHLLVEALDNAIDELINNYATRLGVFIDTKNKVYSIVDNGRGIPLGNIENIPIPVVLATQLFSGGKFTKQSYKISTGLHGVGLGAVNALSEFMEIDIFRNDPDIDKDNISHGNFKFSESKITDQNISIHINDNIPYNTRITFKPYKKYFDRIDVNIDHIRQRLLIASIFSGSKEIILYIDDKREIIKENMTNYFKNKFHKINFMFDPIIYKYEKGNESLELIFSYSDGNDPMKVDSSVNLLPVVSGTHVNVLYNEIRNIFKPYMKDHQFLQNDVFTGFKCYFNIFLSDTSFDGQTKDRLSTSKSKIEPLFENFSKDIHSKLQEINIIDILLDKFDAYRSKLKVKNVHKNMNSSKFIRGRISSDSKLVDCKKFEKSELFIIEGDSAGGTCVQARDPDIHAILPLKGKVLNVASKNDLEKILKNNEVRDILRSLGCGYKSKNTTVEIENLRYEKIILAADADADGKHINTLLMAIFMIMVPEVIEYGHLYIADMPLYGVKHKKKFIPCWSESERDDALKKYPNAHVTRFKGLGEMNDDELFVCLFDEKNRKLYQVQDISDEEKEKLIDLLINANERKKLVFD